MRKAYGYLHTHMLFLYFTGIKQAVILLTKNRKVGEYDDVRRKRNN